MKNGLSKKLYRQIALCISISVHLFVFGVFAIVEFCGRDSSAASVQNDMTSGEVFFAVAQPIIVAVPKVESPKPIESVSPPEPIKAIEVVKPVESVKLIEPITLKSESLPINVSTTIQPSVSKTSDNSEEIFDHEIPVSPQEQREEIKFFGTGSSARTIVYVVDSSGSMLGLLGGVKEQLKQSISSLGPEDLFYIIFFGNEKIYESGHGELVAATRIEKNNAEEFINSVRAGGKTNALDAVERAMRIKGDLGSPAGQVFFLTDGFDLEGEHRKQFLIHLKNIRKTLAPKTTINTIGFWTGDDDTRLLEEIAVYTGGVFTSVQ